MQIFYYKIKNPGNFLMFLMHYFLFFAASEEYNELQKSELVLQGQAAGK